MYKKNNCPKKIRLLFVATFFLAQHISAQTLVLHASPVGNTTIAPPESLPNGIKKINDEDAYTQYAIYDDAKYIFIKLYITDSLQKRKVLKNGMEVWIDVKGKKNKVTGILFPLATGGNNYLGGGNRNAAGGPPPSLQNNHKNFTDTAMAVLAAKRQEMELKGFGADVNGTHAILQPPPGFTVALQMVGDTLVYSAIVPKDVMGALSQLVSIGIVEKGIELPGFGDMDGGPGGDGGGPPGGGAPGGGEGGLPPGPPPGDMQDGAPDFKRMFETNVIWYKLKLHS